MEKFQNKYRIPSARLLNWDYGANGAYFITICTHKMQCFFGEIVETRFIASAIDKEETRFIASANDNEETRFNALVSDNEEMQAADNRAELQYQMQLNELGKIVHDNWTKIPNEFPYVELANFQIMPNHMHGILIISKDGFDENVEPPLNACVPNTTETRLITSVLRDNAKNCDDQKNCNNQINPNSCNPDISEIIKNKGGITGNHNPMLHENISRIIRWYKGKCSFEMRKINPDFKWHSRFHDHIIRNSAEFERVQNYIAQNPAKWSSDKFYK